MFVVESGGQKCEGYSYACIFIGEEFYSEMHQEQSERLLQKCTQKI